LLLRERSGTSPAFRAAVAREIQHFVAELSEYLVATTGVPREDALVQSEASVTLVFSSGAEALDLDAVHRKELSERLIFQLRMLSKGAYWYRKENDQ
jgi:hypothetical protein